MRTAQMSNRPSMKAADSKSVVHPADQNVLARNLDNSKRLPYNADEVAVDSRKYFPLQNSLYSFGFFLPCKVISGVVAERYPIAFLQCFATAKWALVFLSVAAIFQGFIVNGHTNVIISTIEKRFELSSTESGLIASCFDIAACVSIPFITYIGGRGHKPLWLGWGVALMGLGSIVFSLPHFTAPPYAFADSSNNTCGDPASGNCLISTLKNYRLVFYLAMLMTGIGSNPLYSLGVTYLDENVKQRFSALYNGVYMGSAVLGPGVGFLAGAAFLRIYTNPSEKVDITESNENWVGAWWLGALLAGCLTLVAAVPVLMFPKRIPGWEKKQKARSKEAHAKAEHDEDFGKRFKDFPKALLTLLKNPTFVCLGVAGGIDSLTINGLATFGPKYLETIFGFGPSAAGLYFGLLGIVGAATGQVTGGVILSRFNLSLKRMLQINYLAPALCIFLSGSFLISCGDINFAGVNQPYQVPNVQNSAKLEAECNAHCGCSSDLYNPVCGSDNVTYYSPCYAGCVIRNGTSFSNCSCVSTNRTDSLVRGSTATLGVCPETGCGNGPWFIVFCIVTFFLMFFTFLNESSALQATLRVVSFHQRSFGVGIQWLSIRLLGTIPGPLIVGAIFDSACAKWSEQCGTRGACLSYHNKSLSVYIFLLVCLAKAVNAAIYLLGSILYKPRGDATYDRHMNSVSRSVSTNLDPSSKRSTVVSEQPKNNGVVEMEASLPGEIKLPETQQFFENTAYEDEKNN